MYELPEFRYLVLCAGGSGGFLIPGSVNPVNEGGAVGGREIEPTRARELADAVKHDRADETEQHSLTNSAVASCSLKRVGVVDTATGSQVFPIMSSRPAISSRILSTFSESSSVQSFFSHKSIVPVLLVYLNWFDGERERGESILIPCSSG